MRKLIKISIAAVLMSGAQVSSQEVEYVGSTLWAGSYDVEIIGDYAYCAFTNGLLIFDISDPANPVPAGRLFMQQEAYLRRSVGIRNDYAYIANCESALVVVDVADPSVPTVITDIELPEDIWDLQIVVPYIYVADDESGLQIINIEDPEEPVIIGDFFSGIAARSIYVQGDYAYIARGWHAGDTFHIIDVSDPANPELIGECADYSTSLDICVSGDYAYVACYDDGLRVYDVADQSQPQFIGDVEFYIYALNVAVDGDYAYVVRGAPEDSYLDAVNISDPEHPEILGTIMLYGWIENLKILDTKVYVVSVGSYGQSRLDIIDISEPGNPARAGYYDTSHSLSRFDLFDNYVFVADGYTGIKIVDAVDYYNPFFVGLIEAYPGHYDVSIQGNYAYLSGGEIYDITDPNDPLLTGDCGTGGYLDVEDTLAYFIANRYLKIVDVSEPTDPVILSSLDLGHIGRDVIVRDNYCFIANGGSGLRIVDISDPVNPIIRTTFELPNGAGGVYIRDEYCYVNFYSYNDPRWGKLFIVNVSNPINPFLVGEYETANDLRAVAVRDDYAYLAVGEIGLEILDITDLSEPSSVLLFNTSGYAEDIKLVGDHIYLSNQNSFMILHFNPLTGIVEEVADIPDRFFLLPNYPNPFNSSTTINYDLPVESNVRLEIYDVLGRRLRTLVNRIQPAGRHSTFWNAEGLPSCLYFYRLTAADYSETGKCILLK